jgi:sugar phosphate isomerase/epimerase
MRLGLSSFTFPWSIGVPGDEPVRPMGLDDLLDTAVDAGADVLQVADNLPLDALPEGELSAFAGRASAAGVALEVGTRGIAPERVRRHLAIACTVGSPIVRVVVDSAGHHPSPEEVVVLLAPHAPAFRRAGVVLAIENHDRFPVATLRSIVERLGTDWAGICLDTVNSFGALEGPAVVVGTLAPLAVNLHVKDFVVTRYGSQMGFTVEGRAAGQGSLDVPWLFGELVRAGRADLTAVIELWTPRAATLEETVATEQHWARESVAFLRPLVDSVPAGRDAPD